MSGQLCIYIIMSFICTIILFEILAKRTRKFPSVFGDDTEENVFAWLLIIFSFLIFPIVLLIVLIGLAGKFFKKIYLA